MNATATRDQLDAATAEVVAVMDTLVLDKGWAPGATTPTPWLLDLITATVGNGSTSARTCRHVAARRGPAPVHLIAHLRRVVCTPCAERIARALTGTAEDTRCDVCRTTPADGLLHPVLVSVGPVAALVSPCAGCRPRVVATSQDTR